MENFAVLYENLLRFGWQDIVMILLGCLLIFLAIKKDRTDDWCFEVKDKVIYINGQKIKCRGVNRHDSDPITGFAVTLEQMEKGACNENHYINVKPCF